MKIGDWVDITQVSGVCIFCEKIIFLPGMAAGSVRKDMLDHIKICPEHPFRGFNPRKYKDDARGSDEGESPYRPEPRNG